MTVKEIYEKTKFGKEIKVGIRDYKCNYLGSADYYLEMYKKAFRKNSAFKYREIRALLDRDAVVIEHTDCAYRNFRYYEIVTRRTFEGAFSEPLKDHEKIILE